MQPDWFKQIKQPSDEKHKNIYPVIHFKLFPFLILALLCCLWALLGALMLESQLRYCESILIAFEKKHNFRIPVYHSF
jgi:hypothetical protein